MNVNFAPLLKAAEYLETEAPVVPVLRVMGINSDRVFNEVRRRLTLELKWDRSIATGSEAFARDMRAFCESTGPNLDADVWTVIHGTLTGLARGYANYTMDCDRDMLHAAPARELLPPDDSREQWQNWWRDAGGRFYNNRMIALALDSIWKRLSDFGLPWPPFAIGSRTQVENVLRDEAKKLGLI